MLCSGLSGLITTENWKISSGPREMYQREQLNYEYRIRCVKMLLTHVIRKITIFFHSVSLALEFAVCLSVGT